MTITIEGHTRGPWHIGTKPGPMIYGPQGEQIADMRGNLIDDAEYIKNMRLIAAAPDLLVACEAVLNSRHFSVDHDHNRTREAMALRDTLRAAIALAKGE